MVGDIYIITDNELTYSGELIKKKRIELSKIESSDTNERYLAFVYPSSDKISKLCDPEQLRLCENYLLKIGKEVGVFKIGQKL